MSGPEFMDLKIGQPIVLNGYPMELVAVGSLKVAGGQRVEIAQFQRLEEPQRTPGEILLEFLEESGFQPPEAREIIGAALGRLITKLADIKDSEFVTAEAAIQSAMLDRDQLEEGRA